jgi:hypothetical protein
MSDRQQQPKKKKRSGSSKRQRDCVIKFRAKPDERAEIKARAEAAGLTVGSFIRSRTLTNPRTRAVHTLAPAVAEFRQFKGLLGRVGGNLAQFLRLANRGEIVPPDELAPAVQEARDLIAGMDAALEGKL